MEAQAGDCRRGGVGNSRPRSNLGVTVFSLNKVCMAGAVAAGARGGRESRGRGSACGGGQRATALQLRAPRASISLGLRVL